MDPVARLRAGVARVEQLRPVIEPILREEGVPADVSAIVLVESGGLPKALSPKGARGLWQFMPQTARRYGLAVSDERDERLDVAKSTRAAARYLRDLHQLFGDWRLAFAAYNAGEQTVVRAIGQSGQRDFFGIEPVLPQETRRYVPAVLQAIDRVQRHQPSTPTRLVYASFGPSN
jgi:membrane-bound lytic murein transglycosylase D